MTEISQLIAGGATRTSMRAMSGIEFLRGLMDGTLPPPAFSSTSRIKPVEVAEGRVVSRVSRTVTSTTRWEPCMAVGSPH